MEIYFVKISRVNKEDIDEKIKADSKEKAIVLAQEKYPDGKIMSVKQLLND